MDYMGTLDHLNYTFSDKIRRVQQNRFFLFDDTRFFHRRHQEPYIIFCCSSYTHRYSSIFIWQEIILSSFMLDGSFYDYRQEDKKLF